MKPALFAIICLSPSLALASEMTSIKLSCQPLCAIIFCLPTKKIRCNSPKRYNPSIIDKINDLALTHAEFNRLSTSPDEINRFIEGKRRLLAEYHDQQGKKWHAYHRAKQSRKMRADLALLILNNLSSTDTNCNPIFSKIAY